LQVKDLRPANYNPRKISDQKLKLLAAAMREFGDLSGIVFNRRTGNLVGGHQRVKSFDQTWKVVKRDCEDIVGTVALGHVETPYGQWIYREVDWPKEKEMAANLAANKHSADWDFLALNDVLASINDMNFNIALTGFDEGELDSISIDIEKTKITKNDIKEKISRKSLYVKTVIAVDDIAGIELALRKTGITNRGDALKTICEDYLENRQLHAEAENFTEEELSELLKK